MASSKKSVDGMTDISNTQLGPGGGPDSLKVAKPGKFSGSQGTLKPWLLMIAINFKTYPSLFQTEVSKVLFVISYLEGAALSWVISS